MRALSILLLLGGDVELNPRPHQIMLIRRCNSLSKLSTVDENILSGLSIPDLLMDYVCHVAVNPSGLSIPDLLMDYVCHVAVNPSGLSIPDLLMDYVCHVAVNLSGLSKPDQVMDCVCHVPLNLSRSSVPNCNMDYVCHGVMPSAKRDIHLADMSTLLLLLGGRMRDMSNCTCMASGDRRFLGDLFNSNFISTMFERKSKVFILFSDMSLVR